MLLPNIHYCEPSIHFIHLFFQWINFFLIIYKCSLEISVLVLCLLCHIWSQHHFSKLLRSVPFFLYSHHLLKLDSSILSVPLLRFDDIDSHTYLVNKQWHSFVDNFLPCFQMLSIILKQLYSLSCCSTGVALIQQTSSA